MDFVTDENPRSSVTPQRGKSQTSVELDIQVEEGELRAKYQQAVQSHFQHDLSTACMQYDALLKSDLLRPQVLLAAVQQMRDAYEEGVASTRSRLTLRYLTLKNRGKIEEDIVEERSKSTTSSDSAAVTTLSQSSSQSQSPSPTPPLSASTSSAALTMAASIGRALQFYIASMDMASALATLQANLEQGEHMDQDPSAESGVAASSGVGESGQSGLTANSAAPSHRSEILVEDVSLWQSIARTAGKCHQYPLARHALEQAFKLQPDNMQIVDKLVDLLYVCSDYFMVWSLLQHGLKHLQTGGGESVTITTTTAATATTSTVSLTLKFQVMQLQLLSWNIPDEQTKLTQEFEVLRDRLYGHAVSSRKKPPSSQLNSKSSKSIGVIEQHLQEIKADYAKHAAEANEPCLLRPTAPTSHVTVE